MPCGQSAWRPCCILREYLKNPTGMVAPAIMMISACELYDFLRRDEEMY
jgi:hypothetical protein